MSAKDTSMMTHPYAELFPMMGEKELRELADDIKVNGLRESIIRYDGKILEGRNRYVACGMAGVEPRFEEWSGNGSLVRYVWSRNYIRRHLNTSQRAAAMMAYDAMLAKEAKERMSRGATLTIRKAVANLPHSDGDAASPAGRVTALADDEKGRTRDTLAELANVSPRLIQDAKRVHTESPELFEQVKAGELTVNGAMKKIKDSRDPGASKRVSVVDPVSELVGIGAKLRRTVPRIEELTTDECRSVAGLAKAINNMGFLFSQLLPVLVRTGDEDAIALARKTIAALGMIPLDPNPDGPNPGSRVQPAASTPPTASECAAGTPPMPIDPAALDWPQTHGLKIVMDAHVLKLAVKRASVAAMTKEGQSLLAQASYDTRGCVRISAKDGKVTFESVVSGMSARHVVPVGGDAMIVSDGETCIPAKDLKVVAGKLAGGSNVSLAFVPDTPCTTVALSEATKAIMPDGVLEIGSIKGDRVIAKTTIDVCPASNFAAPKHIEESELTVLMAGKASAIKGPCGLVAYCINTTDHREIYDKFAIFTAPDSVYFLGSDGRRCAVVQAKADSFDRMLGSETTAPVLVDFKFLSPILASLGGGDPIAVGIDSDTQRFCVVSGQTTYCVNMIAETVRMKYPNYKRLIERFDQPGAVILVNRAELCQGVDLLNIVNEDTARLTFSTKPPVVTFVCRGITSTKETSCEVPYRIVGDNVLKGDTISLVTSILVEGLKKMSSDNIRLTFTADECSLKIEDDIDPKLSYYMLVENSK